MTTGTEPRIAVVGAGYWGKNLVRNFDALGVLEAVVDADPATRDRLAGEHGVRALDFDTALASSEIDAVAIAAPAESHGELAIASLEAGKHVFCEKPLALRVSEAEKVVATADSVGRTLMVGHLLQYHPGFLKLKELCEQGELGRVQYLYSNRLNLGRIRREEDILWSFAPHDISMILALVGGEPEEVSAIGARYLHKSIADVTTTHLSFPGGEEAHVFVSWLHPFKEQKLIVVGDRGMAVFDDGEPWESKLLLYRHRIDWNNGLPAPVRADAEPIAIDQVEPLREECRHFVDCVRTGATPRTDGREGIRVLRVLEAAAGSMAADHGSTSAEAATGVAADAFVHPTSVVDEGALIGEGTSVWHYSHVMSDSVIGRDCTLGQNVFIAAGVTVGDGCKIQNNVSLFDGVRLGDGVFCGPSAVFTNVDTPRADIERKDEFLSTPVGDGASIGANATIVCGNEIGERAFVAAGAVVAADVPPFALAVGVPSRQVGWVSHAGEVLGDDLVCPRSGRRYEVVDGRLEEIG